MDKGQFKIVEGLLKSIEQYLGKLVSLMEEMPYTTVPAEWWGDDAISDD